MRLISFELPPGGEQPKMAGKNMRFSEENGDDGRFYNRSNLQVSPKNTPKPSLFSILLLKFTKNSVFQSSSEKNFG